jgi:hypothetical protein
MKRSLISLVSILPLSFAACGSSSGGDCTPGAGGSTGKYVADTLTVPADRTTFSYDLVGSGRPENQLGIIMGALSTNGLNPQTGVDMALMSGQVVLLLSENSADSSFSSDTCASASVQNGKSTTTPPTAGATYTTDPSATGGTFAGPITGGTFASAPSATTKKPVTMSLELPLVANSDPLKLTVYGAHVQFHADGTKVTGGVLNGAIKSTDVNNVIIPKVTDLLNNKLTADKGMMTSTDMSILTLFDNGGQATGMPATGCSDTGGCTAACQNPMSASVRPCMCAVSGDQAIDVCEVATSTVIKSVLAPDVQMFDASGNYAPNPNPTMKDSLSLGIGFTAIKASF